MQPPPINILNTQPDEDMWFTPHVKTSSFIRGRYLDETLIVYGLYEPSHFSHYIFNGLLPLYSTIREYAFPGTQRTRWTLRAETYRSHHTPLDMEILSLPEEHDIVLQTGEVSSRIQRIAPMIAPMCFARAVVGTGNRCSMWYCERNIPREDYTAFVKDLQQVTLHKDNPCLNSVKSYGNGTSLQIVILNREQSRHITNIPDVIEALLDEFTNATINLISFDEGCDIRSTAYLVERADVMIATFGNGLGSGLFMKKDAILISIDSRWYNEDWFYWPMVAAGIRLYTFECQRELCQEPDETLLNTLAPELSDAEKLSLMTDPNPSVDRRIIDFYRKDQKRRVDIERFVPFLKDVLYTNKTYEETCGHLCQGALQRHRGL
jgi:hypothetical protein